MKNSSLHARQNDFWRTQKTKFPPTINPPSPRFARSRQKQNKHMPQAIGLIETRGLVSLVEGTDAMLKAANVELAGPMTQVGNALVTAVVVGDVAAVKAATDAGAQAIKAIKGEVVSVHVIARPHADVDAVLPKKK
jgi:ethanolamine utilization protein EutM